MAYWFLGAGLLLILLGSEAAIRGGVGLARSFDVSPLMMGVFVIAAGTSAPELFVSLKAAAVNAPALVLGGLVGTGILNILFVVGFGALIHPMASSPKVVLRDGGAMLAASILLVFVLLGGVVSRQWGVVLLVAFAAYVASIIVSDWRRTPDHSVPQARALYRSEGEPPSTVGALFLLLLGFILLALGAHFTVAGSVALARQMKWDEAFVGLTVVALSLSVPKLVAMLSAVARGHTAISVGQLIEANVFDLLGVLGITALVVPLAVPRMLATTDVSVLAASSIAVLPLLAMRWRLSRLRGMLLMLAYGCYIVFIVWRQGILPIPGF
jgi:cation:H+ antiporter